ncbi:NAC transcription factors 88, partial [Fagus crenata]
EVVEMISNSSKIEYIDLELEASEQQYGSEVAWQRRKFEHIQVQERQNNLNFLIGCREKMIQKFPMGFRFSPTDKELINHYLRLKIEGRDSEVDFIPEVDFYKYEPWHLPEFSATKLDIPQWLFFCRHDGTSDYRPTNFGYWKATGKPSYFSSRKSGPNSTSLNAMKKTLVYYRGDRHGGEDKGNHWVMHEFSTTDPHQVETYYALAIVLLGRVIQLLMYWLGMLDPNRDRRLAGGYS